MKKIYLFVMIAVMATGWASSARAGDVTGKVKWVGSTERVALMSKSKERVVVWLEGAKETRVLPPLEIAQKDMQFSPDFLVVTVGQLINMPNQDDAAHNVYSHSGLTSFNLGIFPKGESRSVTLDKPGIIDVFCSFHHAMHARLLVVPTSYFAMAQAGGVFAISHVPPGTYTLKAWHERSRIVIETIVVPETGALTVTVPLEEVGEPKVTARQ